MRFFIETMKERRSIIRDQIKVGIGFATGRKSFQNVLRSYIFHLEESEFLQQGDVSLNLFVAFDPTYYNTTRKDYEAVEPRVKRCFDAMYFLSPTDIRNETDALIEKGVASKEEAGLLFGNGYAAQRNIVLFEAMKQKMDYLVFFDDDEYPMAVTNSNSSGVAIWSGQHVIETHVKYLQFADMTNGYHCGYISPLPSLEMDGILDEHTFREFVEAMSSDVLQWDEVKETMKNGGVTYADRDVIVQNMPLLVEEINHAKFITGGNLGINLTDPSIVVPFYNPPGARGEDSFMSTCLVNHTVKRIPAYTFHDGFSLYSNLLRGVLPTYLKSISHYDSQEIVDRFYRACIGWARYKPLYMMITHPDDYSEILKEASSALRETIPSVCAYFNSQDFNNILDEFEAYSSKIDTHFSEFQRVQAIWTNMKETLQ